MNSSTLKYNYEINNKKGHFFDRKTMNFFGDTMRNYGVITHEAAYELHRKSPVNGGLCGSTFFTKGTFQIVEAV